MKDNSVSIVLPIFNKERLIGRVIDGILNCISDNVKELLIIFDGCTDKSFDTVLQHLSSKNDNLDVKLIIKPQEEYETKCCNTGFKTSSCQYSLNIQDDQILKELDFDKRLSKPFSVVPNLLAVSARDAVDCAIINGRLEFINIAGKDVSTPRNLFCIRDIINRGPVLFDNEKLKELNYLNEDFCPQNQDDSDLSLRAYRKGYLVGCYAAKFESRDDWGSTRNPDKAQFWDEVINKHIAMIAERHADLINAPKHDQDIEIE